jgi:hypothetical protein
VDNAALLMPKVVNMRAHLAELAASIRHLSTCGRPSQAPAAALAITL